MHAVWSGISIKKEASESINYIIVIISIAFLHVEVESNQIEPHRHGN